MLSILGKYPCGKIPFASGAFHWRKNLSNELFRASSSFQIKKTDVQLRDQLKQRELELQRKNERIRELEQQQKKSIQRSSPKSTKSKSAFISMKI